MDTMVNHLDTPEWSNHGHALENGESSGTKFSFTNRPVIRSYMCVSRAF